MNYQEFIQIYGIMEGIHSLGNTFIVYSQKVECYTKNLLYCEFAIQCNQPHGKLVIYHSDKSIQTIKIYNMGIIHDIVRYYSNGTIQHTSKYRSKKLVTYDYYETDGNSVIKRYSRRTLNPTRIGYNDKYLCYTRDYNKSGILMKELYAISNGDIYVNHREGKPALRVWHANGTLKLEAYYIKGNYKRDDETKPVLTQWYDNKCKALKKYSNSIVGYKEVAWHSNGNIEKILYKQYGILYKNEGPCLISYYSNKQLHKIYYNMRLCDGNAYETEYYPNGNLKIVKYTVTSDIPCNDGVLSAITYYENKAISSKSIILNGNSTSIIYYDHAEIITYIGYNLYSTSSTKHIRIRYSPKYRIEVNFENFRNPPNITKKQAQSYLTVLDMLGLDFS